MLDELLAHVSVEAVEESFRTSFLVKLVHLAWCRKRIVVQIRFSFSLIHEFV